MEDEGANGDATATGLALHLGKPRFIVKLYFLSDVLCTVGSMSTVSQSNNVNLIGVEKLLKDKLHELEELEADVYSGA